MVALMEQDDDINICSSYALGGRYIYGQLFDIYEGSIIDGRTLVREQLKGTAPWGHLSATAPSLGTQLYRIKALKRISGELHVYQKSLHADRILAFEIMVMGKVGFVFQVLSYWRPPTENKESLSVLSLRVNIAFQSEECLLYRWLPEFPDILSTYKTHRYKYAIFLLKNKLRRRREVVNWHKEHLERPLTAKEYVRGTLLAIYWKCFQFARVFFPHLNR
jgi:hypothetical protein